MTLVIVAHLDSSAVSKRQMDEKSVNTDAKSLPNVFCSSKLNPSTTESSVTATTTTTTRPIITSPSLRSNRTSVAQFVAAIEAKTTSFLAANPISSSPAPAISIHRPQFVSRSLSSTMVIKTSNTDNVNSSASGTPDAPGNSTNINQINLNNSNSSNSKTESIVSTLGQMNRSIKDDTVELIGEEEQQNVPPELPLLAALPSNTIGAMSTGIGSAGGGGSQIPTYRTHRSNSACVANTTIPAQFASRIARRNTQVLQPMSIVVESAVPFQRPTSRTLARSTVEKTMTTGGCSDRPSDRSSSHVPLTTTTSSSIATAGGHDSSGVGSGGSFELAGSGRHQSGDSIDSSTPPSTPVTKHVTLDELILGEFFLFHFLPFFFFCLFSARRSIDVKDEACLSAMTIGFNRIRVQGVIRSLLPDQV